MPPSLPPLALFSAAAAHAAGICSMGELARRHGVPVSRLRHELTGIRHKVLASFVAWLDADPARRAALPAVAAQLESETQKFIAEFEAQERSCGSAPWPTDARPRH